MIINSIVGGGLSWPTKLVVVPYARRTKVYSSGSWVDDPSVIETNTDYSNTTNSFTQKTKVGDTQTVSYYKFYVEFDNGQRKELWDLLNENKTIDINATGNRTYTASAGGWNSYFVSNLGDDGTYNLVNGGSSSSTITRTFTLNKSHFPYTQSSTGVNLTGIIFYVSTYNSTSASTYVQVGITINSISIDGVALPIEVKPWS